MFDSLKLKLKKTIGGFIGTHCKYCGKPMEDYGYNFHTRCSDPDCLSHPHARERFDIPKEMVKTIRKRGRPKKQQSRS